MLEHCLREELNKTAPRVMAVLKPLRVVIENYPEGQTEQLDAINNPEDPSAGVRKVPFGRVIYIEQDDFREEPPPKYFRLTPGREVRLRYAYFIKCVGVVKDEAGNVTEVRCTYDPATRGGDSPDGRKVKATIHWVAADGALPVRSASLRSTCSTSPTPTKLPKARAFLDNLNPNSLEVLHSFVEPSVKDAAAGIRYQFERNGYFCVDADSTGDKLGVQPDGGVEGFVGEDGEGRVAIGLTSSHFQFDSPEWCACEC